MGLIKRCGAYAAVLFTLALTACGGGGVAAAAASDSAASAAIAGVSTPSSVSLVTAKNAD